VREATRITGGTIPQIENNITESENKWQFDVKKENSKATKHELNINVQCLAVREIKMIITDLLYNVDLPYALVKFDCRLTFIFFNFSLHQCKALFKDKAYSSFLSLES